MLVRAAFLRMTASRAVSLALMAVGFAVLGRLLPPAAFGHFALALALYGLTEIAVQFGLRQYVIRSEDELSRRTVEAAAGLSLAIACGCCLLGLVAAWGLGGGLLPAPTAAALVPLSLTLLISPFLLGTQALLQRSLRFGLISVTEVVRVAVDVAVSVSLALLGFGALALALAVLASHLAVGVLLLAYGGRETRIRPRLGDWRSFVGWGGRLTAIQFLPKAGDVAMLSMLSVLQGAAVLGLFNRARTIHRMLDQTVFEGIKPVVLPALSSAIRNGSPPAQLYALKLDYLMAICWPGFALIALLAQELVAVLLGDQWDAAVPAVRILALMGLALPVTKMSQSLFVAIGEPAAYLRLLLVQDMVRLPLAVAGAFVSLEAFAAAYVAGNWVKAISIAWFLRRRFGHDGGAHRRAAGRAVTITLTALAGPALVMTAALSPALTLLAALPLAVGGWLAGAALVRHPVIGELLGAARDLRRAMLRPGQP